MTKKQRLIFDLIRRAADAGLAAPSNLEIANAMGSIGVSSGAYVVQALEREGHIKVERFGASRRITICATGKSTFARAGAVAHWRSRVSEDGSYERKTPKPMPKAAPAREHVRASVDFQPVSRDPCPNCGVRGDIGCEHSRRREAAWA